MTSNCVNLRITCASDQGDRKYMEDFAAVHFEEDNDETVLFSYFAVFDGHGGPYAARYAKEHMIDEIAEHKLLYSNSNEDLKIAMKESFYNTHMGMWKQLDTWPRTNAGHPSTAGSTAVVAVIRGQKLIVAHAGDSSAIMGYNNSKGQPFIARRITRDHKPDCPIERERIREAGGLIMNKAGVNRVVWNRPRIPTSGPIRRSTQIDRIPFLAVARSLGDLWSYDYYRDEYIVSPEPDIFIQEINPKSDRCIILASDGLWNMVTPYEAVTSVYDTERKMMNRIINDPECPEGFWINPAEVLVNIALERWRRRGLRADNTTVVVAMLDPPGSSKMEIWQRKRLAKLGKKKIMSSDSESSSSLSSATPSKRRKLDTDVDDPDRTIRYDADDDKKIDEGDKSENYYDIEDDDDDEEDDDSDEDVNDDFFMTNFLNDDERKEWAKKRKKDEEEKKKFESSLCTTVTTVFKNLTDKPSSYVEAISPVRSSIVARKPPKLLEYDSRGNPLIVDSPQKKDEPTKVSSMTTTTANTPTNSIDVKKTTTASYAGSDELIVRETESSQTMKLRNEFAVSFENGDARTSSIMGGQESGYGSPITSSGFSSSIPSAKKAQPNNREAFASGSSAMPVNNESFGVDESNATDSRCVIRRVSNDTSTTLVTVGNKNIRSGIVGQQDNNAVMDSSENENDSAMDADDSSDSAMPPGAVTVEQLLADDEYARLSPRQKTPVRAEVMELIYWDPSIAGIHFHLIRYQFRDRLNDIIACKTFPVKEALVKGLSPAPGILPAPHPCDIPDFLPRPDDDWYDESDEWYDEYCANWHDAHYGINRHGAYKYYGFASNIKPGHDRRYKKKREPPPDMPEEKQHSSIPSGSIKSHEPIQVDWCDNLPLLELEPLQVNQLDSTTKEETIHPAISSKWLEVIPHNHIAIIDCPKRYGWKCQERLLAATDGPSLDKLGRTVAPLPFEWQVACALGLKRPVPPPETYPRLLPRAPICWRKSSGASSITSFSPELAVTGKPSSHDSLKKMSPSSPAKCVMVTSTSSNTGSNPTQQHQAGNNNDEELRNLQDASLKANNEAQSKRSTPYKMSKKRFHACGTYEMPKRTFFARASSNYFDTHKRCDEYIGCNAEARWRELDYICYKTEQHLHILNVNLGGTAVTLRDPDVFFIEWCAATYDKVEATCLLTSIELDKRGLSIAPDNAVLRKFACNFPAVKDELMITLNKRTLDTSRIDRCLELLFGPDSADWFTAKKKPSPEESRKSHHSHHSSKTHVLTDDQISRRIFLLEEREEQYENIKEGDGTLMGEKDVYNPFIIPKDLIKNINTTRKKEDTPPSSPISIMDNSPPKYQVLFDDEEEETELHQDDSSDSDDNDDVSDEDDDDDADSTNDDNKPSSTIVSRATTTPTTSISTSNKTANGSKRRHSSIKGSSFICGCDSSSGKRGDGGTSAAKKMFCGLGGDTVSHDSVETLISKEKDSDDGKLMEDEDSVQSAQPPTKRKLFNNKSTEDITEGQNIIISVKNNHLTSDVPNEVGAGDNNQTSPAMTSDTKDVIFLRSGEPLIVRNPDTGKIIAKYYVSGKKSVTTAATPSTIPPEISSSSSISSIISDTSSAITSKASSTPDDNKTSFSSSSRSKRGTPHQSSSLNQKPIVSKNSLFLPHLTTSSTANSENIISASSSSPFASNRSSSTATPIMEKLSLSPRRLRSSDRKKSITTAATPTAAATKVSLSSTTGGIKTKVTLAKKRLSLKAAITPKRRHNLRRNSSSALMSNTTKMDNTPKVLKKQKQAQGKISASPSPNKRSVKRKSLTPSSRLKKAAQKFTK